MKKQMNQDMQNIKQDFQTHKEDQEAQFSAYQKKMKEEYTAYKKEVGVFWEKPKLSTKKDWVSYSDDKKTRSQVDFKNNVITIETVASSKEEAMKNIQSKLAYTVSVDTRKVSITDTLQRRIAKIKVQEGIATSKIDKKGILAPIIFKKQPTKKELLNYTKKITRTAKLTVKKSKLAHAKVYKISVALPTNTNLKLSKNYYSEVTKNAKRFELTPYLVFAIMQTESNFNPYAKSHIPAFGLMQIVPRSAGVDSYRFLYKKKGMPSASYLYNGSNNIEMGSSYLHILYYRYLKKIKDPTSRLYCAIAAYNTGSGNIAWAFTHKYNMNKAAPKINALTSDEVYTRLLSDLRFDEPKHYLKRVVKRISAYKKAYPNL